MIMKTAADKAADRIMPAAPQAGKSGALPALRFPEFKNAGAWEEKKIGDIADIIRGNILSKSDLDPKGRYPCIHYGELFTIYNEVINNVISRTDINSGTLSRIGDILMPSSDVTPEGLGRASALAVNNVLLGNDINIIRLTEKCNPVFVSYVINSMKEIFIRLVTGTTVKHLYGAAIKKADIAIPSLPEQQKIAECLSAADEIIAAQEQKLEALKSHKQGLMQKLFPAEEKSTPALRFPEFRNAGAWEEKRLGDIADIIRGNILSKSDLDPKGRYPCIHYGELFTVYNEVINNVISRTDINSGTLSRIGDILMPSSDVTPEGLGRASALAVNNVLLGNDINIIRLTEKCNPVFVSYAINSMKEIFIRLVTGTTVKHLYGAAIKKAGIAIPSLPEQQKIAECLSAADEIIAAQEQKLEALKQHKLGLMQQLFPKEKEV